jgi:hypothetical protein
MMIKVAAECGMAVLTDDDIAAVAGGIIWVPHWPPIQPPGRPPHDPLPPPGGYTP